MPKNQVKEIEIADVDELSEMLADTEAETEVDGTFADEVPLATQLTCLLFISNKPITTDSLASVTGVDAEVVERVLGELQAKFSEEEFGFSLQQIAGGWQFRTAPRLAPLITRLLAPRGRRLSRAAAETLAVIAYKQPVQRAEIEAIRGVDAMPTVKTLLDLKLIRPVGREDAPGQPTLFGTTQTFLEKFGMKDLSELPNVRELERLIEEPGETPLPEDGADVDSSSSGQGQEEPESEE